MAVKIGITRGNVRSNINVAKCTTSNLSSKTVVVSNFKIHRLSNQHNYRNYSINLTAYSFNTYEQRLLSKKWTTAFKQKKEWKELPEVMKYPTTSSCSH